MSETVLGGSSNSGNPGTGQSGDNQAQSGGTNVGAGATGQSAGSGSGGQASWRDSLPQDLKDNPSLKTFTDVGALAQSYVHAQASIGKKGVILPGDKASEDDLKRFYKELGQPDLDKFELKAPEGVELNEDLIKGYKETAHKAGLLPKQAQGVLDWFTKAQESQVATEIKAVEEETTAQLQGLRKEWGQGYDKQVGLANYVVNEIGGPDFAAYVRESGIGNDVNMIKIFAKIGAALGGEKTIRGENGGKFGQTPAEVQKEIERLQAHPAWADSKHAQHGQINRDLEQLYRTQYPTKTG